MISAFLRTEIENKRVLAIDSFLSPETFAKSGRASLIKEKGIILSAAGTESEWEIKGTSLFPDSGTVIFYGDDFEGMNVYEILNEEGENKQTAWKMLVESAAAISKSKTAVAAAAMTGPSGVFCGKEGDILVFPPDLFSRCISSLPEKKAFEIQGRWIHPAAESSSPMTAFSFTTACAAYKILSGIFPFYAASMMEKDGNGTIKENFAKLVSKKLFIKMRDAALGIKEETADKIDSLLKGETPEGKKLTEKSVPEILNGLNPDLSSCFENEKEPQPSQEGFNAKFKSEERKISRKIELDKKMRKYRMTALLAAAVIIIAAGIFSFYYNKAKNYPDTIGLTPEEVVVSFYKAVEDLNQEIPKAYSIKNADNKYIELTTNIFLQIKIRQAMNIQNAWISPAFFYAAFQADTTPALSGRQIYGLTKLQIERITPQENGEPENPSPSSIEEFNVSFYLWLPFFDSASGQPQGEETKDPPVTVYRCKDSVSLVFSNEKWLISGIQTLENTALKTSRQEIMENAEAFAGHRSLPLPFAPEEEDIKAETIKLHSN